MPSSHGLNNQRTEKNSNLSLCSRESGRTRPILRTTRSLFGWHISATSSAHHTTQTSRFGARTTLPPMASVRWQNGKWNWDVMKAFVFQGGQFTNGFSYSTLWDVIVKIIVSWSINVTQNVKVRWFVSQNIIITFYVMCQLVICQLSTVIRCLSLLFRWSVIEANMLI